MAADPSPASPPDARDGTRPASLWPETTRISDLASTTFNLSRFDPLADEHAAGHARAGAAFDVCHPGLALRAVLLVQLALALGVLVGAGSVVELGLRAAQGAFAGVVGSLVWLVAVCALQRALQRAAPPVRAAIVLGLGAVAALAGWAPLWWLGLSGDAGGLRVLGVALVGAALAALLWTGLSLRARLWQPAQTQARLAELQARIRPHFLFNALNTALALVRVDPERAESVLEDLSALFRVALADAGTSVSLHEEIELAQRYLAIEQVRFGPRLKVRWDIDPRIGPARVPPLILQPLVENAVRHGIEPAPRGGKVAIEGVLRSGHAVLTVSNTLPDEASTPGAGIALRNVQERLRLLHDVAAQCDTWQEDGNFHARITVPLG